MRTFLHRLLGLAQVRGFDAAGGGRRWEGARTVDGLNAAILAGATTAARRAGWYARNNPWVAAAVDSLVGSVVGDTRVWADISFQERLTGVWGNLLTNQPALVAFGALVRAVVRQGAALDPPGDGCRALPLDPRHGRGVVRHSPGPPGVSDGSGGRSAQPPEAPCSRRTPLRAGFLRTSFHAGCLPTRGATRLAPRDPRAPVRGALPLPLPWTPPKA